MRFWAYLDQTVSGPFEPERLAGLPGFGPDSPVCPEGSASKEDWKKAREFSQLGGLFAARQAAPDGVAPPRALARDPDVLIFDDDPDASSLMEDALKMAGYAVERYLEGARALDLVREKRPRLVLLDVMMPGLDGISALKRIKGDSLAWRIKAAIVTGRSEAMERKRALDHGADAFLHKPFSAAQVVEVAQKLIGSPGLPHTSASSRLPKLTLWGTGGEEGLCAGLEDGPRVFILDAGAALAALVERLSREQDGPLSVHLLLSRHRAGHVEGLKALAALDRPGLSLHVYGPRDPDLSLAALLKRHLPDGILETLQSAELVEGQSLVLSSTSRVRAVYSNAPGTSLVLRLDFGADSVVYAPCGEIRPPAPERLLDYERKLKSLCAGADLLLHNARYSDTDYAKHMDEGDSGLGPVVDLALEAGVRRLALLSVEPTYDGKAREELSRALAEALSREATTLEASLPRAGKTFSFEA